MSEPEKIKDQIINSYQTEKGKNFISHLIRSFYPLNKSSYLVDNTTTNQPKIKCCLSGEQIFAIKEDTKLIADSTNENYAIKCKGSNKFLSKKALMVLFNFIETENTNGNKHINWIIKEEMRKESQIEKVSIKEERMKYVTKPSKEGPFRMDELVSLKELKEKLERDEKS